MGYTKITVFFTAGLIFFICGNFFIPFRALAQEEDLRFRVSDVKGHVTAYHDETGEDSRLHFKQTVDEGDNVSTGYASEVVLRLKRKAYVHLAPNTKIHITRLRMSDKGLQCRLNLLSGTVLCQLDSIPVSPFEVSSGSLVCRTHGTLFDVSRNGDAVHLTSFEGSVVTNSHGHVEIAKPRQVIQFDQGNFRYKYYLKIRDEGRLQEWKDHLAEIRSKSSTENR